MPEKDSETCSPVKQGIRSPMNPYEQQMNQRKPGIGTSEVIEGSAPREPAPVRSPTKSEATGDH